jgi:glycosyltransferase involved in cell wall biosynthesis
MLINSNRWLKNSYRAVIAFDRLFSFYPDLEYKVLLLGLEDIKIKQRFIKRLKNPEHFVFSGYIERNDLERLYLDAFCFVYPTLNEGFGYPPLDCMKYGTPVLASAITSVPEVCGEGVMYFSPTSIDEIGK